MTYLIYTDGSYKDYGGSIGAFYSSAAVITPEDNPDKKVVLTKVSNDEKLSMRNVAGEILAVTMALEHCITALQLTQKDKVIIYYDYAGIENWCRSQSDPLFWRSKKPLTQTYRNYINLIVRPRLQLEFSHVCSHTGNLGNESADLLAKEAMERHVKNLQTGR